MSNENLRYDIQVLRDGEWVTIWSDISLSLSKEFKARKEKTNPENKYQIVKVVTTEEIVG